MAQVSFNESGGRRFGIAVEGLDALASVADIPDKVVTAARQAVNRTLDRTRTASARAILTQVNFPRTYLDPSQGRLTVASYASGLQLEGRIRGRDQATSLARFVSGGTPKPFSRGGVTVAVKPGLATYMRRAFIFPLKNANVGLAVRTDGPAPSNAYRPKSLGKGLWLLYGPSINQVFDGVRGEVAPDAAQFMEDEFNRLMELN